MSFLCVLGQSRTTIWQSQYGIDKEGLACHKQQFPGHDPVTAPREMVLRPLYVYFWAETVGLGGIQFYLCTLLHRLSFLKCPSDENVCGGSLGLLGLSLLREEGNRIEQREKLGYDAIKAKASANPIGSLPLR